MANCPNCGGALAPDATYCVKCGSNIEPPAPAYPQSPGQSPQYQPPQGPADNSWAATLSLILGILSLFPGSCCGCVSIAFAIGGIVTGIIGLKSSKASQAKIGIGLSIAGILIFLIFIILQMAFGVVIPGARTGFPR